MQSFMNTDNRLNFGPSLENIVYLYLVSHDYQVSIGKIGKFECDFIVRDRNQSYAYVQVTYTLQGGDVKSTERIKEIYRDEDRKMQNYKILIVEDDRGLAQGIAMALKEENTLFLQAYSLGEARKFWKTEAPDMVLLDINLPDGSGYDFLKEIRGISEIPVLLITANDLEVDEVTGFSLGADDYITKPFGLMVLRARVERMRKRSERHYPEKYEDSGYRFYFDEMKFFAGRQEITLSKTEQKLLRLLTANPGQTMKRERLLDVIWTDGAEFVDENALSVAVNRLRKKLEIHGEKSPIQTVYGIGYQWNVSVFQGKTDM